MMCVFQVKIQGQNEEMLLAACEQFLDKTEAEIQHIALVTLEGHQRAIMGSMTVEVTSIDCNDVNCSCNAVKAFQKHTIPSNK